MDSALNCHSLLYDVVHNWRGTQCLICLDVRKCFDTIPHDKLLDTMREQIADEGFLSLLDKFFKVHIEDEKGRDYVFIKVGIPQGSTIRF